MSIDARRIHFASVSDQLFDALEGQETLSVAYSGEDSQFIRINDGRVRQSGTVCDATLTLKLFNDQKNAQLSLPVGGQERHDHDTALDGLRRLRTAVSQSPDDPFQQLPQNHGSTNENNAGSLLDHEQAASALVSKHHNSALSGFYAAGPIMRGNRNSAGQDHWFSSTNFSFDYTMLARNERSVKGFFAGANWQQDDFDAEIHRARAQTEALELAPRTISPGRHRCYLAPAATAELIGMLSWQGLSEASIRQGTSALAGLRDRRTFSPLFNLKENFASGLVPRFNEEGELADNTVPIIVNGKLQQTLVNSRTGKEYAIPSNAANSGESLRAPELATGKLGLSQIYQSIDTGIYIANLHYLNWSDRVDARVTGMTRYACFWIEQGQVVAPIEDLRFDDSLYSIFGDRLLAVSDRSDFIPNLYTYDRRSLGGVRAPGLLVDGLSFTL